MRLYLMFRSLSKAKDSAAELAEKRTCTSATR